MKIKFKELMDCRQEILVRYGKSPEEIKTKVEYAIKKWLKEVDTKLSDLQTKYSTKFSEGKEDIDIKFAFEKDGVLVRSEKGDLQFSKEGESGRMKELRELTKKINSECEEEEVEFEPYLIDNEILKEEDEEIISKLKNIFIK